MWHYIDAAERGVNVFFGPAGISVHMTAMAYRLKHVVAVVSLFMGILQYNVFLYHRK